MCFVISWRGVFLDKESGIDYYLWGVGSRKGHDDVIAFTKTHQDCEVSAKHNDFDVNEGHSYFITVKVYLINQLLCLRNYVFVNVYICFWIEQYDMNQLYNWHAC